MHLLLLLLPPLVSSVHSRANLRGDVLLENVDFQTLLSSFLTVEQRIKRKQENEESDFFSLVGGRKEKGSFLSSGLDEEGREEERGRKVRRRGPFFSGLLLPAPPSLFGIFQGNYITGEEVRVEVEEGGEEGTHILDVRSVYFSGRVDVTSSYTGGRKAEVTPAAPSSFLPPLRLLFDVHKGEMEGELWGEKLWVKKIEEED